MSRFCNTFNHSCAVLPVIHVMDLDQALENVAIAAESVADGVFLINHGLSTDSLLEIATLTKQQFSRLWVGINCLGLDPAEAFQRLPSSLDGVWVDSAAIDERSERQSAAEAIDQARRESAFGGLYFGGVAFKYQRPVEDLESACRKATCYVDVVTTSGPGTGSPPDLGRIRRMKTTLGTAPLAIASGMTPENVRDYLPFTDAFLVATGISRTFNELDPARTKQFVEIVRAGT